MHAHAADPLQAYGDLFKSAPLPPLMRQGIMEPHILKHYLLLHDDAAVPGGLARSVYSVGACFAVPPACLHACNASKAVTLFLGFMWILQKPKNVYVVATDPKGIY